MVLKARPEILSLHKNNTNLNMKLHAILALSFALGDKKNTIVTIGKITTVSLNMHHM